MQKATGVQLEASLVPLCEHQKLFDTLVERVRGLGFLDGPFGQRCSITTGQIVQEDAVFFLQI